jgi:hypothetical protein
VFCRFVAGVLSTRFQVRVYVVLHGILGFFLFLCGARTVGKFVCGCSSGQTRSVINYDEMSVATNEQWHRLWLTDGPLWKKDMVARFMSQISYWRQLAGFLLHNHNSCSNLFPISECLKVTDAWKIIYPVKMGVHGGILHNG